MGRAAEAVEAAIAGEAKLDAHTLRADFPIFQQRVHGKPLAYLDSAVTAQKPRCLGRTPIGRYMAKEIYQ